MRHSIATAVIIAALSCALTRPMLAQNSIAPVSYGPTVAPLPPPPPSVVNPVSPNLPNSPPRLDTFGDKVARCLHYGGTQGLTGGDLSAYSRACANN